MLSFEGLGLGTALLLTYEQGDYHENGIIFVGFLWHDLRILHER